MKVKCPHSPFFTISKVGCEWIQHSCEVMERCCPPDMPAAKIEGETFKLTNENLERKADI